jgi:hypothetical protein
MEDLDVLPSSLVLGFLLDRPIHIVVAFDDLTKTCHILVTGKLAGDHETEDRIPGQERATLRKRVESSFPYFRIPETWKCHGGKSDGGLAKFE